MITSAHSGLAVALPASFSAWIGISLMIRGTKHLALSSMSTCCCTAYRHSTVGHKKEGAYISKPLSLNLRKSAF